MCCCRRPAAEVDKWSLQIYASQGSECNARKGAILLCLLCLSQLWCRGENFTSITMKIADTVLCLCTLNFGPRLGYASFERPQDFECTIIAWSHGNSGISTDMQIKCLPTCVGEGAKFEPVTCHTYLNSNYKATHSKFSHTAAANWGLVSIFQPKAFQFEARPSWSWGMYHVFIVPRTYICVNSAWVLLRVLSRDINACSWTNLWQCTSLISDCSLLRLSWLVSIKHHFHVLSSPSYP